MAKRIDYASMYTLRSDGRYMGYWHDERGRHAIYDRDPERLYNRIEEKEAPAGPLTFRAAAEKWESGYRETVGVRTWNNFRPHYDNIVDRWGDLPVKDITGQMINSDLQRAKAQGYSHTIVNSRKVIINGILNQAFIDDEIPYNPCASVRLPKGLKKGKRHAPDDCVVKTICNNIDAPFGFFPFLLLCTGLRKSEALALHKSDVDLKQNRIDVNRSLTYISNSNPQEKTPKSGKARWVPIVNVLKAPLQKHMDSTPGDLLFPQEKSNRAAGGGYMSEHAYENAWREYCSSVGLMEDGKPALTAHALRHGTATLLFESGVDVYTAQQILGHANVSTTMEIYAELRQQQQMKSVKKYNQSLSKKLSISK